MLGCTSSKSVGDARDVTIVSRRNTATVVRSPGNYVSQGGFHERTVRDRLIQRWIQTHDAYYEQDPKRIYDLSLEYLMGRALGNSLVAMGLYDTCAQAMGALGYRLEDLRAAEWDADRR